MDTPLFLHIVPCSERQAKVQYPLILIKRTYSMETCMNFYDIDALFCWTLCSRSRCFTYEWEVAHWLHYDSLQSRIT